MNVNISCPAKGIMLFFAVTLFYSPSFYPFILFLCCVRSFLDVRGNHLLKNATKLQGENKKPEKCGTTSKCRATALLDSAISVWRTCGSNAQCVVRSEWRTSRATISPNRCSILYSIPAVVSTRKIM